MDKKRFITLVVRVLSGEAQQQERDELRGYLNADGSYREEFELLKVFWENKNAIKTDTEDALQKALQRIHLSERGIVPVRVMETRQPKRFAKMRSLLIWSGAAIFILICLATGYFLFQQNHTRSIAGNEIKSGKWDLKSTARGSRSTLVLNDGTKVILNSDSQLKFPETFSGDKREVFLSGEAFFDVTHNEKAPFIIHTSRMNIRVLGTAFNVKAYPDDSTSEATLIRGIIEVTPNNRPSDKIILRPKEKLILSNAGPEQKVPGSSTSPAIADTRLLIGKLHYISPADSAIVETSWMDNKLVFRDESFVELAADLSRRYDVSIEFASDAPKEFRFTGIFEKETIEQVLRALQLTEKFEYKVAGKKITIY